ncbi:hypothetical protein [Thermoplasma sp.]|uniref:hypothetical protein n=1 Tax=Thermoplasma sp. TaxID=1973142 RepID=UPI00127EDD2E|nr:hypothetical protein [Thermoplasma sp.]KAA8922097.1 MAG: hypothetical protein F6Q11_05985 [Thermoplasma sp.]
MGVDQISRIRIETRKRRKFPSMRTPGVAFLVLFLSLAILGSALIGYSYTQHPTYYNYSVEEYSVNGSANITLYNFFGIPSNLTIMTSNSTVHVNIYIVSEYKNLTGVTVTSERLIDNLTIGPKSTHTVYLAAQYANIPYNVQITAEKWSHTSLIYSTKIEKTADSNIYIETPGIIIFITSMILIAVYLTKFKK